MATAIQTQQQYKDTAILTLDQRTAIETHWKGGFYQCASLTHHLLYAMLRGKDWRKTATPPTNTVKVENGALTGWCFWKSYTRIYHSCEAATIYRPWGRPDEALITPFEGVVTMDLLNALVRRLPNPNDVRVAILDGKHTWTCPAYLDVSGE